MTDRAHAIAAKLEAFVRDTVIPYERDPRHDAHGAARRAGASQDRTVRQARAFRICDGPTEVHKWSLAKKIKRDWKAAQEELGGA